MKSKKLVVLGLSAIALFSSVGVSLAYWASGIAASTNSADNTVTIGSGESFTSTVTLSAVTGDGKVLVPSGLADDANETASATVGFSFKWSANTVTGGNATGAVSPVTLSYTKTVMQGSTDVTGSVGSLVVVVAPSNFNATLDQTYTLNFTVTLTEPSPSQYSSIAGAVITLGLTAAVAAV